ncbi:MAG: CAP domain-containing protein [Pseudomonadota bacterium]
MRKYLSLLALIGLSACIVVPVPVGVITPTTEPATRAAVTPAMSTASFTSQINAYRSQQGRAPLRQSAELTRAAEAHARDMAQRGYFSHRSEGGPNGVTFMQRSRAAGCNMRSGAENIATGQTSEAQVIAAWADSAGHRRNMLGSGYREYGLGRVGNIWVLKLAAAC